MIDMFGKIRFSGWLIAASILAVAECAGVAAVEVTFTAPAQAQFFGDQQYQYRRARPRSGGFLQNLFGPFNSEQQKRTQQPSASSSAPPRKTESKGEQVAPTTSIVVMGDGMADWLAYGLEDAFSDSPEIGIVRKNKLYSGLLQYDAKGDLDWWRVGRDILAQEKADYVVMMLGLSDRQDIREKDLAKEAERKAKDQQAKDEAEKNGVQKPTKTDGTDKIVAPAPERDKKASGIVEFRSDEWEKIYSRRIDETIAALKSKGVPVFWVGLPSIRGARSTADAAYLNDLYRARAERAGVVYIDVWDGFVDEAGKYSNYGPDYEGQTRRLRSSDGVFFTKYGALKLAHYVEHELQRYMNNRATVALPSGSVGPVPSEEKPAVRGAGGAIAVAEHVPLPRPRPPPRTEPQSFAEAAGPDFNTADVTSATTDCDQRLAAIAAIERLPRLIGPEACGGRDMVELDAVLLPNHKRVEIQPAAVLRCAMAESFAAWVRDEVSARITVLGAALRGVENYDSYECRGRNRVPDAKLSEHGKGNAIDVRAFILADGRRIELTDTAVAKPLREELRKTACHLFTTVLGPGADSRHNGHIHLDILERNHGYRICQWDVPEPPATQLASAHVPLPIPRPAITCVYPKRHLC